MPTMSGPLDEKEDTSSWPGSQSTHIGVFLVIAIRQQQEQTRFGQSVSASMVELDDRHHVVLVISLNSNQTTGTCGEIACR